MSGACGRLWSIDKVHRTGTDLDRRLSSYHVDPNITTGPVEVRLGNESGGEGDVAGRVEVLYGDEWGSICGRSWDLADANVICRQLGYAHAIRAITYVCVVFTCVHTSCYSL